MRKYLSTACIVIGILLGGVGLVKYFEPSYEVESAHQEIAIETEKDQSAAALFLGLSLVFITGGTALAIRKRRLKSRS